MKLRELKLKDSELMIEWMHDEDVVKYLKKDFTKMTKENCRTFIQNSIIDMYNRHFAIVDEADLYMGTVSLKNITNGVAEFAIILRKNAMGKGIAIEAMKQLLMRGFNEFGLHQIYWYVSPDNKRAIRFYDKNGYQRVLPESLAIKDINKNQHSNYCWYRVCKGNYI